MEPGLGDWPARLRKLVRVCGGLFPPHLLREITATLRNLRSSWRLASLQNPDFESKQDSRGIIRDISMSRCGQAGGHADHRLPVYLHTHLLPGVLVSIVSNLAGLPYEFHDACSQCLVHSSYIIPHIFYLSTEAEKEQLIRKSKAQIIRMGCR